MTVRSGDPARIAWGALVPVLLVTACLRAPMSSVSPLVDLIGSDTGLAAWALGLLTTVPLLAFAAVSPLAGRFAGRLGIEPAIAVSLAVLALGVGVRSLPSAVALYAGTALIGAGIAVCNVLVPAVLKRDFPQSISALTGLYSGVMAGVSGIASASAVPLTAGLAGRWRLTLALVAVVVLIAALAWLPRLRSGWTAPPTTMAGTGAPAAGPAPGGSARVLRSPAAWAVSAFMGLQSATFYMLLAWLPTMERTHGLSAATAGSHLMLLMVVGIAGSLAIGQWMQRVDDQRLPAAATGVAMAIGAAGMVVAPGSAVAWVVVMGASQGAALVVALALPGLRTGTPQETAAMAGMAQSLGYLLASAGPVAAGAVSGAGGWDSVLWMIAALAAAQVAVSFLAARPRLRPGARSRS
jgi:CP family cyanate transporter-like MFS transporter